MTEPEILKKAIEKAIENGWEKWWSPYLKRSKNGIKVKLTYEDTLEGVIVSISDNGDKNWDGYCRGGLLDWSNGYAVTVLKPESILFDHDFCRAFFGLNMHCNTCNKPIFTTRQDFIKDPNKDIHDGPGTYNHSLCEGAPMLTEWQYHIQQLALATDRLAYLARFM